MARRESSVEEDRVQRVGEEPGNKVGGVSVCKVPAIMAAEDHLRAVGPQVTEHKIKTRQNAYTQNWVDLQNSNVTYCFTMQTASEVTFTSTFRSKEFSFFFFFFYSKMSRHCVA